MSMKVIIKDMKEEDLQYVRENPLESAVKNYPEMTPVPPAFTVIFDDKIVAVGGMIILWDYVGEMWLMLTKDCKREGIFGMIAFETIKNKVDELIEEYKIRRAQCTIRTDFPKAKRMIEALGFEQEGLLRNYTPDGCNVWLYARLSKWE